MIDAELRPRKGPLWYKLRTTADDRKVFEDSIVMMGWEQTVWRRRGVETDYK